MSNTDGDGARQTERTTQERGWPESRTTFKEEWNRRTWYGKAWYPLWALNQILFMVVFALAVFGLMLLLKPEELFKPITKRVYAGISWLRGLMPEVYND